MTLQDESGSENFNVFYDTNVHDRMLMTKLKFNFLIGVLLLSF